MQPYTIRENPIWSVANCLLIHLTTEQNHKLCSSTVAVAWGLKITSIPYWPSVLSTAHKDWVLFTLCCRLVNFWPSKLLRDSVSLPFCTQPWFRPLQIDLITCKILFLLLLFIPLTFPTFCWPCSCLAQIASDPTSPCCFCCILNQI